MFYNSKYEMKKKLCLISSQQYTQLKRFRTKIDKNQQSMSFFRRIFGRSKTTSSPKQTRPDSPTNKVLKKIMFYGFLFFTTTTIISKKYKTNLIFSFEPNEQNLKIIESNPVFYQGIYNPVYWMVFGPLQRIYAKYFQEIPYFRSISQSATKQIHEIYQLPVSDKYSKKENLSVAVIIAGCEGLDIPMKKLMLSMNSNGFRTYCVNTDDFHDVQRLQKTIQHIKSKNPGSKVYGIGLDYGANLLVNFTAQNQKAFNGIVSLGNPLNLEESEKNIQNSNFLWKKILYEDMLKGRVQKCKQNRNIFGQRPIIGQNTQLYEIDRACYSGSYDDYQVLKQNLSSINSVKNLKVPSLFIQSQQDPFSISLEQNEQKLQNSNCIFVESQRGGHLEWFESMKKIRWVSRPIAQYLKYLDGRLGNFA